MNIRLSILICSIYSRSQYLERLLAILVPQIIEGVEILVCKDNVETNISVKRNYLLHQAIGDYVCYVDDDDYVSDDYISLILSNIIDNPDCCGIRGTFVLNGLIFENSIRHKNETNSAKKFYYLRTPNHLFPLKREIALNAKFPVNYYSGEDMIYADRILKYIIRENFIDKIIYFYTCYDNLSEMLHEKVLVKRKKQIFTTEQLVIDRYEYKVQTDNT